MIERLNRIWLPRTGQATSYRVGDGGYFQAGNPRATRFVDNGNGTITDLASGIMRIKQVELMIPGAVGVHATNQIQRVGPNYGGGAGVWVTASAYLAADLITTGGLFYVCATAHTSGTFATDLAAGKWRKTVWIASAATISPAVPATMTWNNAIDYCLGSKWNGVNEGGAVGLSYAGYDDWRLCNRLDLASLFTDGVANGLPAAFPNIQTATPYWTSNTRFNSATVGKYVQFDVSETHSVASKGGLAFAMPVRGGQRNANR